MVLYLFIRNIFIHNHILDKGKPKKEILCIQNIIQLELCSRRAKAKQKIKLKGQRRMVEGIILVIIISNKPIREVIIKPNYTLIIYLSLNCLVFNFWYVLFIWNIFGFLFISYVWDIVCLNFDWIEVSDRLSLWYLDFNLLSFIFDDLFFIRNVFSP